MQSNGRDDESTIRKHSRRRPSGHPSTGNAGYRPPSIEFNGDRLVVRPEPKIPEAKQRQINKPARQPLTLQEVRDLVVGTSMIAVDHLRAGAHGWADFIRGSKNGVRGTAMERLAVAVIGVSTIATVAATAPAIYSEFQKQPTAAESLIDNTRRMELDTGRSRLDDRRAKIDEFKSYLGGVLPEETLADFDYAMSNPDDGEQLRAELSEKLDELNSLSLFAAEVTLIQDDSTAFWQVAARLSALQDKGFIDGSWRKNPQDFLRRGGTALDNITRRIGDGTVENSPVLQAGLNFPN